MNVNNKLSLTLLLILGIFFCANGQQDKSKRWEEAIQTFEKYDAEMDPGTDVILFVGSSSITIWKDIDESFPNYNVLNRGFGGSQFSDLLKYADRVIYPYKPTRIFIYEGDNDIAAGDTPNEVLKEAKQLRKRIEEHLPGTPVIFISAKPSVARKHLKDQYEAFNNKLERYARHKKNTMFADVYSAMLDEDGEVFDHIFLKDNLHMNEEGYQIWQSVLAPYLKKEKKD